jgi:hypothetical protein
VTVELAVPRPVQKVFFPRSVEELLALVQHSIPGVELPEARQDAVTTT